jgi:dihydroorotase
MNLLIKSATLVDKNSPDHLKVRDILIEEGIIKAIGENIQDKNAQIIDLPNLHVSKGWFDSSVSFGEPGYEERETLPNGLDVCQKSGFTSVVINPNTNPVADHASIIEFIKNSTRSHCVDVYPIGALTEKSNGQHIAELYDMKTKGAVAFGDYKTAVNNANIFKIALQYSKTVDTLIQIFANDKSMSENTQMHEGITSTNLGLKASPRLAEIIQIKRDLEVLKYTGGRLHFACISTSESVDLIKDAIEQGLDVSCSVALPNLIFKDEMVSEFDSKYKVLPPLRESSDIEALKKALLDGTIDMLTTDHYPLNVELKKTEFEHAEFGSIGLESALGMLQTIFNLEDTIDILTRGKRRFRIKDTSINVGENAQLSLFNPEIDWVQKEKDIASKSKNSIYLGEIHKGKAYGIINNNNIYVSK